MNFHRVLPSRYFFWSFCGLAAAGGLLLVPRHPAAWAVVVLGGGLFLVGLWDFIQPRQAIRRNYPILAWIRFFLELIRPEIRQYFLESDTEKIPFSRAQRSLVYQRAKNVIDKRAYGTQLDVYEEHYEWVNHSVAPVSIKDPDFRVTVGAGRAQPYPISVLNISAMSFGALSANAVLALNKGAKKGGFAHDTGEGSISRYHREHGGDLIWEIGSGYFGCRNPDGTFNAERFADNATDPQVKLIELKISQGAKPGHGGVLPGPKVSPEIAEARGVPEGVDCISPSTHSAFRTPVGLLEFIDQLRTLSGGKPVGFKLCIGHPWEFFAICKAMLKTGITPDFIVVDGAEGGTGAAPVEFTDHVGAPLQEGLLLVHNTLVGLNLRQKVRVAASGKIISAFDIARTMALGADWCNSARGFMFALGCIQAQTCHSGHCPTGVTTQSKLRQRALVPEDKAERVYHFHHNTMHALAELVGAAGLAHPSALRPHHIVRRVSANEVRLVSNLIKFVQPGDLLHGRVEHSVYALYWKMADADSFQPLAGGLGLMAARWEVAAPHLLEVTVGEGDLDEFGHANNVVYLRWLERVAWDHSRSLGLGMEDYRRLGCGCVVRRHELEYLAPAFAGDRLALGTWVQESDGKLSMWRGYQIVRIGDGRTVLRGRTHWVCVDLATGKPRRMPPEFVNGYRPVLPAGKDDLSTQ